MVKKMWYAISFLVDIYRCISSCCYEKWKNVTNVFAVGTGLLWWMYVSAKYNLDIKPFNYTLPSETSNADTYLWYSIAATVLTVSVLSCSFQYALLNMIVVRLNSITKGSVIMIVAI